MTERILFYGGSPCAGKSTIAARLAAEWGMRHYCCDEHLDRHIAQAATRGCAMAEILRAADHEFIFMRSHAQNLDLPITTYSEILPDILGDLLASDEAVIAEGAALMPQSLERLGVAPARALYQVPTEAFQRTHYAERLWVRDRLHETSDPGQAFENWMLRDVAYARGVVEQAATFGYRVFTVDLDTDFAALDRQVRDHFAAAGIS